MSKVVPYTSASAFTLPDCTGSIKSLSDYLGTKNVLMVFNRGFL